MQPWYGRTFCNSWSRKWMFGMEFLQISQTPTNLEDHFCVLCTDERRHLGFLKDVVLYGLLLSSLIEFRGFLDTDELAGANQDRNAETTRSLIQADPLLNKFQPRFCSPCQCLHEQRLQPSGSMLLLLNGIEESRQ